MIILLVLEGKYLGFGWANEELEIKSGESAISRAMRANA
jgi:hypothetical protein